MFQIPGHDCVMKGGQAAEGVKLILEFTSTEFALFAETEKL